MSVQSRMWGSHVCVVAAGMMALAVSVSPVRAQVRKVPVESLIYDLKSPDHVRRRDAAHGLGAAKCTTAIPDLVAMTRDPDASVRREVEASLEEMEDMSAVPGFIQFTGDTEKDIRGRSVEALVSLHLSRSTGAASSMAKLANLVSLRSADEYADTVVEPDVPVAASVVDALRVRLGDPEVRIRRSASRGLGILRADAAISDLIVAFREDRDDEVRFESVRALRKIGDPSAGSQILPFLNINNDRVRNETLVTLGGLRFQPAVSELTRVFDMAKPADRARSLALSALADIADPASGPLFQQFKADKDETIRLYANEGLARLADPSLKIVISGDRLTEKSARVQTAQAFALLRLGEVEYLDELVRALANPTTRDLAKEYLVETEPARRSALFNQQSEKPAVRAELADIFGLMRDRAALPRLQELEHDLDASVARLAERAVRRVNASPRGD